MSVSLSVALSATLPVVPVDGAYARRIAALPEDAEEIPPATSFGVILQSEHVTGLEGLYYEGRHHDL